MLRAYPLGKEVLELELKRLQRSVQNGLSLFYRSNKGALQENKNHI